MVYVEELNESSMEFTTNLIARRYIVHPPPSPSTIARIAASDDDDSDTTSNGSTLDMRPFGKDLSVYILTHGSRFEYGKVSLLNSSFRCLIRSGEIYRQRRLIGKVEHWIYFCLDLMVWHGVDPVENHWFCLPAMIPNEVFKCSDKESLGVGTELLVFGRDLTDMILYKYSHLTNSWSIGRNMNRPRCMFASGSFGEIGIVAGGCDIFGEILNSAEIYNSETGLWETIPGLNIKRKSCSGVMLDGKFYVIGGLRTANGIPMTSAEMYDFETKTWTLIPDMSPYKFDQPAITSPPLLAVADNELYAADHEHKRVLKYDKRNNTWSSIGPLPYGSISENGWGLAFRGCGDRVVCIAYTRRDGRCLVEVNVWVPSLGPLDWTLLGYLQNHGNFVYNCAVMGM